MPTTFNIGIDWNRDGFICWDAQPGDALNLIPTPLYHSQIDTIGAAVGSTVAKTAEQTAFGVLYYRCVTGTNTGGGMHFGRDVGQTNDISVSPSSTYRARVWVRGISNYSGVPMFLAVTDQASNLVAFQTFTPTANWQAITANITTVAASTHLHFSVRKNTNATNITFDVMGFMLVAGSAAPSGFNTGVASDVYERVTGRTLSVNWFLGMRKPYQETADNSALALVLNNADRLFSPERAKLADGVTDNPLYGKVKSFKPVRVQSDDGSIIRTHWAGWIDAIQPAVNQYGQRITKIIASGPLQFYRATETKIELQEDKRTDEVIAELIKGVVFPPALASAWVLGRSGNTEVSATTFLADTSSYSDLEPGKLTLKMAADNWIRDGGLSNVSKDTFDVYQAIQDITAAEHGKFLFNREGKALFWNRHHLLQGETPGTTFDNSMTDLAYVYAGIDEIKNEVIVICHPRTISPEDDVVLWELGDAIIRVESEDTREVYVKYEDESGKRIGAKDVTVTDIEYEKKSATVTATLEEQANGANLKFVNNDPKKPALIKKCVVRGRKIVDSGEMEAKATDNASLVDYGRRTLRINLPSVDDLEQAQYIADFERDRRGQPRGTVTSLTLLSHINGDAVTDPNRHGKQLSLTLGDLVQITEAQTGHSANHHIIGESHEIKGHLWKTQWYFEPAHTVPYPWKLTDPPQAELGNSDPEEQFQTRLAY